MAKAKYRIGTVAKKAQVSIRTVRYYESLGLIKSPSRSDGGQRYYSDKDVLYLRRIIELKSLDFSLEEIKKIIQMSKDDKTGTMRRSELLHQYRNKLSYQLDLKNSIEAKIDEISWHVRQLESGIDFTQCPGLDCLTCPFKESCRFYKDPEE